MLDDHKGELRAIAAEIAQHCPCGARPESPDIYPHVLMCPVYRLLKLLRLPAWSIGDAYNKAVMGTNDHS